MKAFLALQAVIQLVACQDASSSSYSLASSTIQFMSPTSSDVIAPTATSSCQCENEGIFGEIIDSLEKAVDAAVNAFKSGINVFDLPDHINSLQSVFKDLAEISGDIDCISYNSQAKFLNAISQLLEIDHQLLEGLNSLGVVQVITPILPGLNIITEGISSTIIQVGGGLSRHPCCVLWEEVNASSDYIDDVNKIIDGINEILPLAKLKHISGFHLTVSSGDCPTSSTSYIGTGSSAGLSTFSQVSSGFSSIKSNSPPIPSTVASVHSSESVTPPLSSLKPQPSASISGSIQSTDIGVSTTDTSSTGSVNPGGGDITKSLTTAGGTSTKHSSGKYGSSRDSIANSGSVTMSFSRSSGSPSGSGTGFGSFIPEPSTSTSLRQTPGWNSKVSPSLVSKNTVNSASISSNLATDGGSSANGASTTGTESGATGTISSSSGAIITGSSGRGTSRGTSTAVKKSAVASSGAINTDSSVSGVSATGTGATGTLEGANSTVTAGKTYFTTYCPSPTTFTYGSSTYTVTKETTMSIEECDCTESNSEENNSAILGSTKTAEATVFTTYCPSPTTFTHGSSTYTVSGPTSLTIGQSTSGTPTAATSVPTAETSSAPHAAASARPSESNESVLPDVSSVTTAVLSQTSSESSPIAASSSAPAAVSESPSSVGTASSASAPAIANTAEKTTPHSLLLLGVAAGILLL